MKKRCLLSLTTWKKHAFDRAGLIYGLGHAVYSKSDPRAVIFKSFVEKLSEEKGLEKNLRSTLS